MRTSYTSQEDEHLLEYIAEVRPLKPGRQGQEIYKTLVANVCCEKSRMQLLMNFTL